MAYSSIDDFNIHVGGGWLLLVGMGSAVVTDFVLFTWEISP
jgi:hypothetical protein